MVKEAFIKGFASTIDNNLKTAGFLDPVKNVISKIKRVFSKAPEAKPPTTKLEWGQPVPSPDAAAQGDKPSFLRQGWRFLFGGGPAIPDPLEITHEVKELPFGEIAKMVKKQGEKSGLRFAGERYRGEGITPKHIEYFQRVLGYEPHHVLPVYVPKEGITVPYQHFKKIVLPSMKAVDEKNLIYEIGGQKFYNPHAFVTVGKGKRSRTFVANLSNPEDVEKLHYIYKKFRAGGAMEGAPHITIKSMPSEPVGFWWGEPGKTLEELQHKGVFRQGLKTLFSLSPQERLWWDMLSKSARKGDWNQFFKTLVSTQSISPMLNFVLGKGMPIYGIYQVGKNIDWTNPSARDLATLFRTGIVEPALWGGKYPLGLIPFMGESFAGSTVESFIPDKGIFGSNLQTAPGAGIY
jgi:hypothetical protein